MYERQLMEQNLAMLLEQQNYQSVGSNATEEDPVNPFHKRVFEKKLRRSSVASENKHPNIRHTSTTSCFVTDDFKTEIDQIFTQTQVQFEKIRRRVINHCEGMDEGEKYYKGKELVDNVKKAMNFVKDHVENSILQRRQEKISSTFELKTYDCNHQQSMESVEEEGKNFYFERYENKKEKSKRKERGLSGSMVSNGKKSIYESVLEERKLRKNKKKMI